MKLYNNCFFAAVLGLAVLAVTFSCKVKVDPKNPYNLEIINSIESYKESVLADENNLLINLKDYIPNLVLDIRYADTNNFTHKKIYTQPKAYVRKPVAEALLVIQNKLNEEGLGLKIYDAYRPYAATLYFYEVYRDTTFVAAPWKGSIHNRGCAVDLSLIDLSTGQELLMPTPFDDFSPKAALSYMELDSVQIANRDKLVSIMTSNGFTKYDFEWWHFNIIGRDKYKLMDISFEDLENVNTSR